MEIQLREYQQKCVDIINNLESGSYLAVLATGLGKTVIFSHIKRKGRMLILSHREELVWQPQKYFDCSYGVEQAKHHSNGEEVVSASIQTLVKRLDKFKPDDFDIIVTDEAHHAVAKTYRKIYDYFKPRLHIGFTATPNRFDKVKLGSIFENIIFERNLKWGIRQKYLSDIRCLQVDVGYDLNNVHKQGDDLNLSQLSKAIDTPFTNHAVAEAYKQYAIGQTLIFTASVSQAEHIAEQIEGAVVVSANTDNRDEIINKFTNREIPCLINCMVFTEGTDMPLIETVIIARPTTNTALYTQMVGRGLRLHPEKKELLLLDCVGISDKLNICQAPSLLGIDIPEQDSKKYQKKLLTEIEEEIEEEQNNTLVPLDYKINAHKIVLFENNGYDTHNINFTVLPDKSLKCSFSGKKCFKVSAENLIGNSKATLYEGKNIIWESEEKPVQDVLDLVYDRLLTDYSSDEMLWNVEKVNRWGGFSATEKQKTFIHSLMQRSGRTDNINYDTLTKAEASVIIDQLV